MFEINISPKNKISQEIAKIILQHSDIKYSNESSSGRIIIYADKCINDTNLKDEEESSDEWI
jgi:hypothetical protein